MGSILLLDTNNRVTGYNSSASITSDTPVESNQVFKSEFDFADMFKIYNADADTFTADDQTESLANPPIAVLEEE